MPHSFPSVRPSSRSYKPGEYPQTQFEAQNGAKSYTTVYPKVYRSSDDNTAKLQKDIDWLKGKGYLKELTDEENNAPKITGNGLANL